MKRILITIPLALFGLLCVNFSGLAEASPYHTPKEGLQKSYYKSGQLWKEENFHKGKREGLTKVYYESGQLQSQMNYLDGEPFGKFVIYYESGKVMMDGAYKRGRCDINEYFETGELKRTYECQPDSKLSDFKEYDKQGRLRSVGIYNGRKYIKTEEYDENGALIINKI